MSDKPREFWIVINDYEEPSHIAHHKKFDGVRYIHTKEVLPPEPSKVVQMLQMSHLFQRDENIRLTQDRDKWRGIATSLREYITHSYGCRAVGNEVKDCNCGFEKAKREYEKECK